MKLSIGDILLVRKFFIVEKQLPAKQGLKRFYIFESTFSCFVEKQLPAKQGLKLIYPLHAAMAHRQLKNSFQQNKD
ncbi:hypothetical protein MSLAZ_2084 [Methanosarcina lacustris Z-7289]|uniref:Uncharacterized protein n=1 Tax=Methanosarcina lacustris Z-7289 TaxID=1434111 RepID=A0A0E3WRY4_9EURY|nr:hypothetical protein MSLAZ_2084 [Methanosarcina lacustris Z-7289]